MVLETVLPTAVQNVVGLPETAVQQDVNSEHGHGRVSTEHETATTGRCTDYWAIRPENGGLSRCAKELIGASWRPGTEGQYSRAWRRWLRYCKSSPGVSPITPSLNQVIEYLTSLYTAGLQYRTINVHRSALSMTLKPVEGFNVGDHPLVRRLMKGVFNVRPPKKKLVPSWSVQKVLDTLAEWSPSAKLDLKTLTYKTVMLVSLATAKRCSSLSLLSVKPGFCEISGSQARLQPDGLEKHSREEYLGTPVRIKVFKEDVRLDPVHYLRAYVRRTRHLRQGNRLFVSVVKPHKAVLSETISRWLRSVISLSGQWGTGGSVRSVSTSCALGKGATLQNILEAGDWARVSTFRRYYYDASHVIQDKILGK